MSQPDSCTYLASSNEKSITYSTRSARKPLFGSIKTAIRTILDTIVKWSRPFYDAREIGPGDSLAVPSKKSRDRRSNHLSFVRKEIWWRRLDSNQRPTDYETVALTT